MHSLYEIETTVKRSAKSQGLSWGVSEEIGKAVRVLEQSGLQGLESFKNIIDYGFDNLIKLSDINQKETSDLCPIHFGIFFQDQSHLKEMHQTFEFKSLQEPLICIPFLIKAAKKNLIYFHIHSDNLKISITPSEMTSINQNKIPNLVNNFSIHVTPQRQSQYSDKTWEDLYQLSLETFVEETEEKKLSGAGAGLSDND
tara:strand:- start:117 stop:713 length:597 start_codon:yes stop_codon:yes gene_type:complete